MILNNVLKRDFKLALIQFAVSNDKSHNLSRLGDLIHQVAQNNAKMVILPECFNSPYGNTYFKQYSEDINNGPSMTTLSNLAKQYHLYIVGGSIPERGNNEKFMNTCMVFDPSGRMIKVYRKMHLFDIDIPGKMTFKESETLSPGNELGIVETEYGKIGIGICYDVRFPELASLACSHGCFMMIYPGAFNTITGPLHWHLLMRTRALDQLMYVSAVSPARDPHASYQAYGHSMVVDPFGRIITEADTQETILYADIKKSLLYECRQQIPVLNQKRNDIYRTIISNDS